MDVGKPSIVDQLKKLISQGEIDEVEGLWVTHYHHDHTDGIPEFQAEFDCPCFTDRRLAQILVEPTAWRLPCLIPEPITVHRPMEDGESWRWHEFKLTSYYYPGQTLYHSALLAQTGDSRMLFVGDSHTMSGIDDYCAYNRNWLGSDVGFEYCLSLIENIQPTHMFNCHVKDAFTFTEEEIRFMRQNLRERESLFRELTPWDHANYAMDASWVRSYPYTQVGKPGSTVQLEMVIANHSSMPNRGRCRAVLADDLGETPGPSPWISGEIGAKEEGGLKLSLTLRRDARLGRHVIPVDIEYAGRYLPSFSEAIIDVI